MDRISNLPETILCEILSYLSTKEAVATSVLSSKWRYAWISLPNLDLDDSDCRTQGNVDSFVAFVDRVLNLRNPEEEIDKFSLKINYYCHKFHFSKWVSTVANHGVKNLALKLDLFFAFRPLKLPLFLFLSRTVVVLKLTGPNILLSCPSFVSLPSLKILRLSNILLENGKSLPSLLSSCPVLEDLYIERTEEMVSRENKSRHKSLALENLPECLHSSSLKSFFFRQYNGGYEDEEKLIRYILENARVLKEVKIKRGPGSEVLDNDLLQNLLLIPRASPMCQLSIS